MPRTQNKTTAADYMPENPTLAQLATAAQIVDSDLASLVTATVHPSSILRARTDDEREAAMREFVADLTNLAKELPESALLG